MTSNSPTDAAEARAMTDESRRLAERLLKAWNQCKMQSAAFGYIGAASESDMQAVILEVEAALEAHDDALGALEAQVEILTEVLRSGAYDKKTGLRMIHQSYIDARFEVIAALRKPAPKAGAVSTK